MLRTTRTFVTIDAPPEIYDWFKNKLREAGYDHAIEDSVIDLDGLALERDHSLPPTTPTVETARLPCDVKIGPLTFEQGMSLSALVEIVNRWYLIAKASQNVILANFGCRRKMHS